MESHVIIPSPDSDYVELARTREYSGQHWRKHILNLGTLIHPKTGETLKLDDAWYSQLKQNFDRGVCPIVQVPLANAKNEHVENPDSNVGEVMGISREGSKVYVDLDIRDPKAQEGLKNRTLLGASAFLHLDYKDTRTGKKVGPALLHSCVTNRPYVTDLDDYEAVTATMDDSTEDVVVLAAQEAPEMTKDELIAQLKAEHGIDVDALQSAAEQQTDLSALTAALTTAIAPASTSPDEVSLSDVVQAVAQVAERNLELRATVDELKASQAANEVDGYISTGLVMPKQRDAFIKLALTDRDMLAALLPEQPIVKMSDPEGVPAPDSNEPKFDLDQELARLTNLRHELSTGKAGRKS